MRQLRLVGLNEDGSRLVLRDEGAKTDYLLPVDERLSAALRGDRARLGQLEITLESQLRPREMQSRVRAGESPEQVAKAAGLPLDRVLRFVAPVIAEREHIVEQAQRAAVRRSGGDGPGPVLEPTVVDRLGSRGVADASLRWDAWRRDDGRWTVQASYALDGRDRSAQWTYDGGAHSVVALDDEARALTGARPAPVAAIDEGAPFDHELLAWDSPPPRLATVPAVVANPDAAGSHCAPHDRDAGRSDVGRSGVGRSEVGRSELGRSDVGRFDEGDADVGRSALGRSSEGRSETAGSEHDDAEALDADDEGDLELAEARSGGRSARRAHVPSWDEIMFGRRRARD